MYYVYCIYLIFYIIPFNMVEKFTKYNDVSLWDFNWQYNYPIGLHLLKNRCQPIVENFYVTNMLDKLLKSLVKSFFIYIKNKILFFEHIYIFFRDRNLYNTFWPVQMIKKIKNMYYINKVKFTSFTGIITCSISSSGFQEQKYNFIVTIYIEAYVCEN